MEFFSFGTFYEQHRCQRRICEHKSFNYMIFIYLFDYTTGKAESSVIKKATLGIESVGKKERNILYISTLPAV